MKRRRFLQQMGASAALLPFLPAQLASAQQTSGPRRLVVWWTPNGLFHPEYAPDGAGATFSLRRVLEPLGRHRDKLVVLRNLDWASFVAHPMENTHSPAGHSLTGAQVVGIGGTTLALGPSIDQFIAQRLARPGTFDGMALGVDTYWPDTRLYFRAARDRVVGQNKPADAWKMLFGSAASSPEARDRKSVIDNVRVELQALAGRLAADDRRKIEAHLDHLRTQELRLAATSSGACRHPAPLMVPAIRSPLLRDGPGQMEVLFGALRCDLTRVASLTWAGPGGAGNTLYDWLGATLRHHDLSHGFRPAAGTPAYEALTKIGRWHAEQLALFADKLASVREGTSTMLDNTLILWTTEHAGNKPGAEDHDRRDVPFVLLGGPVHGGQLLDCKGRAHNDLLVTVCHAMGFRDVTKFGEPSVCRGPISELLRG